MPISLAQTPVLGQTVHHALLPVEEEPSSEAVEDQMDSVAVEEHVEELEVDVVDVEAPVLGDAEMIDVDRSRRGIRRDRWRSSRRLQSTLRI